MLAPAAGSTAAGSPATWGGVGAEQAASELKVTIETHAACLDIPEILANAEAQWHHAQPSTPLRRRALTVQAHHAWKGDRQTRLRPGGPDPRPRPCAGSDIAPPSGRLCRRGPRAALSE